MEFITDSFGNIYCFISFVVLACMVLAVSGLVTIDVLWGILNKHSRITIKLFDDIRQLWFKVCIDQLHLSRDANMLRITMEHVERLDTPEFFERLKSGIRKITD